MFSRLSQALLWLAFYAIRTDNSLGSQVQPVSYLVLQPCVRNGNPRKIRVILYVKLVWFMGVAKNIRCGLGWGFLSLKQV